MDKTPVKGGRWRTHTLAPSRGSVSRASDPRAPKSAGAALPVNLRNRGHAAAGTAVFVRNCIVGREIWNPCGGRREVLEGGSRASAPKVSRAQEGKLTIRLAKVPLVDRPAFSIKPLAEYLSPVLL